MCREGGRVYTIPLRRVCKSVQQLEVHMWGWGAAEGCSGCGMRSVGGLTPRRGEGGSTSTLSIPYSHSSVHSLTCTSVRCWTACKCAKDASGLCMEMHIRWCLQIHFQYRICTSVIYECRLMVRPVHAHVMNARQMYLVGIFSAYIATASSVMRSVHQINAQSDQGC